MPNEQEIIAASIAKLREEIAPFNSLGLSRVELATDSLVATVTYFFAKHEEISLSENDWVSPSAIVKKFLHHGISLPSRTNWDAMRMYSIAAATSVERDDGWAVAMSEYMYMRPSSRDYLVDPTALNLIQRGVATSVGYGPGRLVNLSQFATWMSKTRSTMTTTETARIKMQPYTQPAQGLPDRFVVLEENIVPIKRAPRSMARESIHLNGTAVKHEQTFTLGSRHEVNA